MNAKLMKYTNAGRDYLICDSGDTEIRMNPRAVRMLCARNFGLSAEALLEGTMDADGTVKVRAFHPDGARAIVDSAAVGAFFRYLMDRGYTCDSLEGQAAEGAVKTGTVYLMEEFLETLPGIRVEEPKQKEACDAEEELREAV